MLNRKFQLKETILSNSLFYSYPNSYSFLSSELFELNKSQVTSLAGLSFIGRLDKLLFRGAGFGFSSIGGKMSVILTAERSEEHTSELQSRPHLVCRLL